MRDAVEVLLGEGRQLQQSVQYNKERAEYLAGIVRQHRADAAFCAKRLSVIGSAIGKLDHDGSIRAQIEADRKVEEALRNSEAPQAMCATDSKEADKKVA